MFWLELRLRLRGRVKAGVPSGLRPVSIDGVAGLWKGLWSMRVAQWRAARAEGIASYDFTLHLL